MKTKRTRRRGVKWMVLPVIVAVLIGTDRQLTPVVSASVAQQAERQTGEVVSEAVQCWLAETTESADVLTVVRGTDGAVQSMQTDTARLSQMQAVLTRQIQHRLDDATIRIAVPLGTLLRLNLLRDRGPRVTVRFAVASVADCRLDTGFRSAGINQTWFEVNLTVTVTVRPLAPGRWTPVETTVRYCVVQTMVAGAVPNVHLSS